MRDAAQSVMDLVAHLADSAGFLEKLLPLGGIQFTDKQRNLDLDYLSPAEWKQAQAGGLKEGLPSISEPRSVTGDVVRNISQFMRRRHV